MKKFDAAVYIRHDVTGIEAENELDLISKLRNYISKDEDFMVLDVHEKKEDPVTNGAVDEKAHDSLPALDEIGKNIEKEFMTFEQSSELNPNSYYKNEDDRSLSEECKNVSEPAWSLLALMMLGSMAKDYFDNKDKNN